MTKMTSRMLVTTASIALLSSCGGGDGGSSTPTPTPSPTPTPTPAPPSYTTATVGTGSNYNGIATLPDGRVIFEQRDGTLLVGDPESTPTSIGTVTGTGLSDTGALGIAVDPQFATTGRIFLSITEGTPRTLTDIDIAVVRVTLATNAGQTTIKDQTVIWRSPKPSTPPTPTTARFGGSIAVDPMSGDVLLATGDFGDQQAAQDLTSFAGKVLRMTADGAASAQNPDLGAGTLKYIYSYGHRQPTGMTIAADGTIYEVEDSPHRGDELNQIKAGANYGWPLVSEGSDDNFVDYPKHSTNPAVTAPLYFSTLSYDFNGVIKVNGTRLGLENEILIGTSSPAAIIRLSIQNGKAIENPDHISTPFISALAERNDGNIYGISSGINREVFKLVLK